MSSSERAKWLRQLIQAKAVLVDLDEEQLLEIERTAMLLRPVHIRRNLGPGCCSFFGDVRLSDQWGNVTCSKCLELK